MPENTSRLGVRSAAASESGSILILTALSIVVMMGIAALAVDASFMYTERNRMAAAADAGAKSAALEYHRLQTLTNANLRDFARHEALLHGFDTAAGSTVTLNRPPSSGSFTSNPNYVEVIVSRPTNTFFAPILGSIWSSVTPGARAVAGTSAGPNCLVTLNQSGNPSLDIGGTVHLNMPACSISANGYMHVGNGVGSINAQSIGVQNTCSGCPSSYTPNMPAASDPLASLPVPTKPTTAAFSTPTAFTLGNNQSPVTLSEGWYSKMDIGNSDIITLNPGTYWVTGPIVVGNSATLTGSGVFIYFAGTSGVGSCTLSPLSPAGCITLGNGATVTLSAQTSGTYEGILFYQARTNAIDVTFSNTSTYTLSGAMYFPSASVTLGNAGGSNDCTMFVAQNINLAGNGGGNMNFSNTCSAYGGSPLLAVSLAE